MPEHAIADAPPAPVAPAPLTALGEVPAEDGWRDERLVPVADAGWQEFVRPAGWAHGHATLDTEVLAGGWVRLRWRCDYGDNPPEPSTMFLITEGVWVR
jgi:hypothetical protein